MTKRRVFFDRLGRADAISWPVFWVTLVSASIGNLLSNAAPIAPAVRFGTLGIAQVVMWIPIGLAWLQLRRDRDRSRPILVLVALAAGLLLRVLVIGGLFALFIGPQAALWGHRIVGALLNVGFVFVVTAYIVVAMRERGRQIRDLRALTAELEVTADVVAEKLSTRNAAAAASIRAVLEAEFAGLDAADAPAALAALQRTAADIVRPLSHSLAIVVPVPSASAPPRQTVRWREALDVAASGPPFRPWLTVSLLSVEVLAGAFTYPPASGRLALALIAGFALFSLANRLIAPVLTGRSIRVRIALVVAASLAISCLLGVFVYLGIDDSEIAIRLGLIGMTFFSAVFGLGVSVVTAATRDRERLLEALSEGARQVRFRLVRVRQAQWVQRKALSRALHGPVQTAVAAAAIRLDAAIREGKDPSDLIDTARSDLLAAIDVLDDPRTELTSFADAVDRLCVSWEGICAIEFAVSVVADRALSTDRVLRACVTDIVIEAISNAIRHGSATHCAVRIAEVPENSAVLHIEVDSDGIARDPTSQRGLGSQLLDDCTLSWSLDVSGDGSLLTARVPGPDSRWGEGMAARPSMGERMCE